MGPGPELDALVAEKVMGWCVHSVEFSTYEVLGPGLAHGQMSDVALCKKCQMRVSMLEIQRQQGFQPSTSIAAAWEVIEKIDRCVHIRQHGHQGTWEANFCEVDGSFGSADTAAHAICLAALKARGVEVSGE